MACVSCVAQYYLHKIESADGGKVTVAEGVVPVGKHHTLSIPEAVDKNTRENILGIAMGTLRYVEHPFGFEPVLLEAGMTSNEIPPYPAGTYKLIADEHCVFYCITGTDGRVRPKGVRELAIGAYTLPQGTVAVLIEGVVVHKLVRESAPTVFIARNGPLEIVCTRPGRLIYMEQAA